jgi:hypothetical protein
MNAMYVDYLVDVSLLLLLLYPCFVMPVVKRVDAAAAVVVQMFLPLLLLLLLLLQTMIVRGWNGPDWMMMLLL